MTTGSSSWIIQKRRLALYARDGWRCVYCQKRAKLTLDHLKPRSLGGSNKNQNLVTACHKCNSLRGNIPWWEFANSDAQKRITKYHRRGMKRRMKLAGQLLNAMSWSEIMYFISNQ